MSNVDIHSKSYQEYLAKSNRRCSWCGEETPPLIKDAKGRLIHPNCETERTRIWLKTNMHWKDGSQEPKKDVEKRINEFFKLNGGG